MMQLAIASNIVIDTIHNENKIAQSLGGPICYCGLTARKFGFEVKAVTKFGSDFPEEYMKFLQENGIKLNYEMRGHVTTRFQLLLKGGQRELRLLSKSNPLTAEDVSGLDADCWIVSPVIDEVPPQTLKTIIKDGGSKNFVMLDPQGYMRHYIQDGFVSLLDRISIDFSGVTAIKADQSELAALTGGLTGITGMKKLEEKGVKFIVTTDSKSIHLLSGGMHYWINIKQFLQSDNTGAGDILASAFTCAYLKEKDHLWALCFGAGAVRAALETGKAGIGKLPSARKIEESASYYYNTVEFAKV